MCTKLCTLLLVFQCLSGGLIGKGEVGHKKAIQLCSIILNPSQYNAKHVEVIGVAAKSIHVVAFIDPACPGSAGNDAVQLDFEDIANSKPSPIFQRYMRLLDSQGAVHLVANGTFFDEGRQYGPEGFSYQLRVISIVDVKVLPAYYKNKYHLGKK